MLGKAKSTKSEPLTSAKPFSVAGMTIVGQQISVEGTIRGKEDLVIDGLMKGTIVLHDHHLTIGPSGQVDADIEARGVTISGRVSGNIRCFGKIEITREAEFNGEIKAKRIAVEDGAFLKAVIELEREPDEKSDVSDQPAEQEAGEDMLATAGETLKRN